MTKTDLLTEDERRAIELAGELYGVLCKVVGDGPPREGDLAELCSSIHVVQRAVMAQAAARAYPEQYRLLGEVLQGE